MKNIKFIILLVFSFATFAQNNWQERMFDKSENFNTIVSDFDYYKSLHLNNNKIPKGLGIKQFERCRQTASL